MKRTLIPLISASLLVAILASVIYQRAHAAQGGYFIERDREVAQEAPGPHNGKGRTIGYIFFEKVPDLRFSFRKRTLKPGASIGYHLQESDEVYYVLEGTGRMTIDGNEFPVKPGDAILTRKGSSHGLMQTGGKNLTIIVVFEK